MGDIEFEALLFEEETSLLGFLVSLGGEVHIMPSCEPVLKVPGGLSVANEYDFMQGWCSFHV